MLFNKTLLVYIYSRYLWNGDRMMIRILYT